MKTTSLVVFFTLLNSCFFSGSLLASDNSGGIRNPSEPDRIIVRRHPIALTGRSDEPASFRELGLNRVETFRFSDAPTITGRSDSRSRNNLLLEVYSLDSNADMKTVLRQLNESGLVVYAEPDYRWKTSMLPNDPEFSQQWSLRNTGQDSGHVSSDINASQSWERTTSSTNIVTAVIDTGIDYTHEDLVDNIWTNPGEIPGDRIDNDNNGYVDDIHGIDCINNDSDPMDDDSHGTHVAGILGAAGNNGLGISGINWHTQIMALKFLGADGTGSSSDAIECLNYAIKMKTQYGVNVRVTNNSWGDSNYSQALRDAIQASANADMLFVAAASNNFSDNDVLRDYPSGYDVDNIIAVASTTRTDDLSWFSNFGATSVDLGAPGSEIISTIPGNQYRIMSGTSMAAPHVAGAATLLWADNPQLSYSVLKNRLIYSADPVDSLHGKTLSGKRLNLASAIHCQPGTPTLNFLVPGDQFLLPTENNIPIKVHASDCGFPVHLQAIKVTPGNGDAEIFLYDNGQGQDDIAGDGVYAGLWLPENSGENITLSANTDSQGLSTSISGQVISDYSMDTVYPYEWIDATTGTKLQTISQSDDFAETIPLGFDFVYYGRSFSQISVSSNGYLQFGAETSNHINSAIPTFAEPNGLIAPYWDDLIPSRNTSANIYSLLEGNAPNRRLTIAWITVPLYNTSGDNPVTFEVTLYEGSNDIIFQYDQDYLADSATIGIEDLSGSFGHQYLHNGSNNDALASISNGQAIRFYTDTDTDTDTDNTDATTQVTLTPTDNANNRVDLGDKLALSRWEHAFFRFDASSVNTAAEVTNAVFRIYHHGSPEPLRLYLATTDNDWNSAGGTPQINYIHLNPGSLMSEIETMQPGYIEFNLTDYVNSQMQSEAIISLEVSSNNNKWSILDSVQGTSPPQLIIETVGAL